MAFPALVKTSDYDVYTKKYLENIALEIKLNQQNFDKNVGFMRTGVQDTERADSRSIEERAGDVEKLKVQARVMLNKISDATNSNEVLTYLVKNGEILFFFIQQFPSIEKQVKKQFSGGIRAPLLISLIYKRFIAQQDDSLLPESAEFDIIAKVMTSDDVDVLLNETKNELLKTELQNVKSQLPPQNEIKRITDDPVRYSDELKVVAEIFKNSPNVDDYNRLIEEYNDASLKDSLNNYDLEDAEQNMINKLNSFLLETASFRNNPANAEKIERIQNQTKSRADLTRIIPKAIDERIKQKTEAERTLLGSRKRTIEELKGKIKLKPTVIQPKQPTLLSELKTGTNLKPSRGRPAGAKDTKPRIRTPKAVKQAERIPEAPTNTPIIIPQAPTNTPETKIVPTGSGLLNILEQNAHRFKVLKGELLAGNTSRKVINEMRSLVKKLLGAQELTIDQAQGILKELKTL
jgi:hypothetical protein